MDHIAQNSLTQLVLFFFNYVEGKESIMNRPCGPDLEGSFFISMDVLSNCDSKPLSVIRTYNTIFSNGEQKITRYIYNEDGIYNSNDNYGGNYEGTWSLKDNVLTIFRSGLSWALRRQSNTKNVFSKTGNQMIEYIYTREYDSWTLFATRKYE